MASAQQNIAFIELFWELMNRKTGELGRVDYKPQKASFDFNAKNVQPLVRSTPEAEGVSSVFLSQLVHELVASRHAGLHAMTVLRHGKIIYEKGFDPYRVDVWHVTYSMCKSFTGMAIGLLIDEGKLKLEDRVLEHFQNPFTFSPLVLLRFHDLTVRHLLTMSSGSSFNEVGAITGNDWLRSFFESSVNFEFGTKFDYNSMNSFVLSALVTAVTGKSMLEYLQEKLFDPMGITKICWEHSPLGITKAGWGLFITQEDAAKLGQLYLQNGVWNGQQLISREWVALATAPQIPTGQEENPWYGFQLWMNNIPGSYMYNGMLGQNVYVYPSLDMVIVVNCGNDEVFAGGEMTAIMRSHINADLKFSDEPLPANPRALEALNKIRSTTDVGDYPVLRITHGGWGRERERGVSMLHFMREHDGDVYEMHSKGIGLFPLIMQVVHNNYTHGIKAIRLLVSGNTPCIEILEGSTVHKLPIGIGKSRHTGIMMNGEEYLVGTQARIGYNEKYEVVLSIRFSFIEEACSRTLDITFKDHDTVYLQWDELPGNEIIKDTLDTITMGSGNVNPLVTGLMAQINPGLIQSAMQSAISPVVHASLRADLNDLSEILTEEENQTAKESDNT